MPSASDVGRAMSALANTDRLIAVVTEAMKFVIGLLEDPDRQGGFFCCLSTAEGRSGELLIEPTMVGAVRPEKMAKYGRLVVEKARRLLDHPDHLTSGQSANEAAEQYPGAIRALLAILSFSGLAQGVADEAICLLAAVKLGLVPRDGDLPIQRASDNDVYRRAVIALTNAGTWNNGDWSLPPPPTGNP